MKVLLLVCFLALAVFAAARPEEHYTDKYDTVNVDEILANRRLLLPYINCILDKGKCSAEGKELKAHIQEALETYCAKCTEIQKEKTKQVIGHLINHEKDSWDQMVQKYDPERKFTDKYEAELKKLQS